MCYIQFKNNKVQNTRPNGPTSHLGNKKNRFISHAIEKFGKLQQTNSNVIIWIYDYK